MIVQLLTFFLWHMMRFQCWETKQTLVSDKVAFVISSVFATKLQTTDTPLSVPTTRVITHAPGGL